MDMRSQRVDYRVLVHHEDGSFWAEVLDLPGCFVSGDSLEEIWDALPEAIGFYLSEDDSTVEVRVEARSTSTESVNARMLVCS